MKLHPKNTDFIDLHSHSAEIEEGVFRIFNVFSSDFPDIPDNRPFSLGLHPWHITNEAIAEMAEVFTYTSAYPNLLAIGEAGLDSVIKTPMNQQIEVFRTQIEISLKQDKPLIIHCVKAFPELLRLRKEFPAPTAWIIHGFNANPTIAEEYVKAGICISFSQRLLRNPEKARMIADVVPISMVFAETDEDSMPIQQVYQNISDLYGLTVMETKRNIFENFVRISKI